jgi:rare lipoprotein A
MGRNSTLRVVGVSLLALSLAACAEGTQFKMFEKKEPTETATAAAARPASTRLIERDVEAPEVFQQTDAALWNGTPSFGGVWVAHPGVTDPERVIIRNQENGKFVIGSLFKRERDNPGPVFQVSSDAANALGILAGAPTNLNVVALRREEQPEIAPANDVIAEADTIAAPEAISSTSLEPLAAAAAAIDKAEGKPVKNAPSALASSVITPAATAPAATREITKSAAAAIPAAATSVPQRKTSALAKPYVQIGIFSVQANATRTSDNLRKQGIVPTVLSQESKGKKFWRVVVGPSNTTGERSSILKKVKGIGFTDAYFVTN